MARVCFALYTLFTRPRTYTVVCQLLNTGHPRSSPIFHPYRPRAIARFSWLTRHPIYIRHALSPRHLRAHCLGGDRIVAFVLYCILHCCHDRYVALWRFPDTSCCALERTVHLFCLLRVVERGIRAPFVVWRLCCYWCLIFTLIKIRHMKLGL